MSKSEYETGTHLTKSDRMFFYVLFLAMATVTAALYRYDVDGFSRISLYATILAAFPASWAWLAGHYSKKHRRSVKRIENEVVQTVRQLTQSPAREASFTFRGETKSLADALGNDI